MDNEKEQVFIRTVRDRKNQMYRIALGYLHSAHDAEDAVSDALETAWARLGHIRSVDALPAYLVRCTINAAKNQLRKRKRTEPLEPYREILAVADSGDPVTGYLSGMKEKDQLLLVLRYQENLREADIASVLHIPRGTVASRLNTLLKRLREEMEKEGKCCD
jgi:RNA polymerase sigma-70 factor (ECF subfamily)